MCAGVTCCHDAGSGSSGSGGPLVDGCAGALPFAAAGGGAAARGCGAGGPEVSGAGRPASARRGRLRHQALIGLRRRRVLGDDGDGADAAAGLGEHADGGPRGERHSDPRLAAALDETLLGIPAEHPDAGNESGQPGQQQCQQAESHHAKAGAGDRRLHRLHGIAPWEERREVLHPLGQAGQLHRDAADDEHRQEDALPQCLHRRHVVGERRDDEAEAHQRERHEGERDPQIERMVRQRHADQHRQRNL